jgi:hypothetical protein
VLPGVALEAEVRRSPSPAAQRCSPSRATLTAGEAVHCAHNTRDAGTSLTHGIILHLTTPIQREKRGQSQAWLASECSGPPSDAQITDFCEDRVVAPCRALAPLARRKGCAS